MPRVAKQLIYGGFYAAIIFGVIWLFYRAAVPAPTCFDGVQNGGEDGVDCGAASCGVLCAAPVLPLQVVDTVLVRAGSSTDVLAHLENPNPLYGAAVVEYTMTVTDSAGAVLATRTGTTYVNPSQPRYILFTRLNLTGTPAKAELQIDEARVQWSALNADAKGDIQFAVRGDTLTVASDSIRYEAVVLNRSSFDFDTVDVTVLLRNAGGSVVSANATVQRTLKAGEERSFVMTWPFPVDDAVRAEAVVTTNVFLNSNFIRVYGSEESSPGF
jgi:hypothetical protein